MAQEVLAVLEAHPGPSKPGSKGMLQIVNPNVPKLNFSPGGLPCSGVKTCQRPSLVRKDILRMLAPLHLHNFLCDGVQDDQPVLTILDPFLRNEKHAGAEFRDFNFIVPHDIADLSVPQTCIHAKQGRLPQVIR